MPQGDCKIGPVRTGDDNIGEAASLNEPPIGVPNKVDGIGKCSPRCGEHDIATIRITIRQGRKRQAGNSYRAKATGGKIRPEPGNTRSTRIDRIGTSMPMEVRSVSPERICPQFHAIDSSRCELRFSKNIDDCSDQWSDMDNFF
jgi:hypothetical protein